MTDSDTLRAARLLTIAQDITDLRPTAREQAHLIRLFAQALAHRYEDASCASVLQLSLACSELERLQDGKQVDARAELTLVTTSSKI